MNKIKKFLTGMAMAVATLFSVPSSAQKVTYTVTGIFSGTNGTNSFDNAFLTFTGVGDVNDVFSQGGANYYNLSSFIAADSSTYDFGKGFLFAIAPNAGVAAFGTFDTGIFLGFSAPTGYDGSTSLASTPISFTNGSTMPVNGVNFTNGSITLGRDLTFTSAVSAVAAVPEPATWAMMLMGFGMLGFAMRRRSNVKTTVSYA